MKHNEFEILEMVDAIGIPNPKNYAFSSLEISVSIEADEKMWTYIVRFDKIKDGDEVIWKLIDIKSGD